MMTISSFRSAQLLPKSLYFEFELKRKGRKGRKGKEIEKIAEERKEKKRDKKRDKKC